MPAEVSLRRVGTGQRPVLERLAQLERHDLSEQAGFLPGPDGRFELPRMERFFTDPDHAADLVYAGQQLAGFALTRPFDDGSRFVHEFFVVRALRRQGVGRAAAAALLRSEPRWTIAFVEQNVAASRFWRAVADDVAGDRWAEQREAAPDGGDTFTLLRLDVVPGRRGGADER